MVSFVEQFKQKVKDIDAFVPDNRQFDLGKGGFTIPEDAIIPEEVQQPDGPLFALYKRTIPALKNSPVLMSLTKQEAEHWKGVFNKKEQDKRKQEEDRCLELGVECRYDTIVFYDFVQQGTEQENILWNPKPTMIGETNV